MTLITHHKCLPSFGLRGEDQTPVYVYTVLSINDEVGDCSAYRGIAPVIGDETEGHASFVDRIRAGGDKIGAAEAAAIFPEITERGLRYRP